MRAGAVAHALYAQLCQFRNWRHARAGQNIDRGFPTIDRQRVGAQVIDNSPDVLGTAKSGNEDAVSAGLEISFAAFQRIAHGFCGLDAGLPVGVRAGVDHQMNSRSMSGAARGLDTRDLLRQRKQRTAVPDAGGVLLNIVLFKIVLFKIVFFKIVLLKIGVFGVGVLGVGVFGVGVLGVGVFGVG